MANTDTMVMLASSHVEYVLNTVTTLARAGSLLMEEEVAIFVNGANASRIVAPVLQNLQAIEDDFPSNVFVANVPNDSTTVCCNR